MIARSISQEPDLEVTRKTLAAGELNLFLMPGSLYRRLSDEASKRNMTVVTLLTVALEKYLTGGVSEPQKEDESPQLLRRSVPTNTPVRSTRKLKGYR